MGQNNIQLDKETYQKSFGLSSVKIQLSSVGTDISTICAKYNACSTKLQGKPTSIEEDGVMFRLNKAKEDEIFKVPYETMKKVKRNWFLMILGTESTLDTCIPSAFFELIYIPKRI